MQRTREAIVEVLLEAVACRQGIQLVENCSLEYEDVSSRELVVKESPVSENKGR
jgi:hypothetical protein